jgi:hypothetical protein
VEKIRWAAFSPRSGRVALCRGGGRARSILLKMLTRDLWHSTFGFFKDHTEHHHYYTVKF